MKSSKFLLFVFLGIVFWFNGAMIVRFLGEKVLTENNPNLIFGFLLAIPVTIVTLIITKYLSGIKFNELLKPVVIMTFTATLCDGIALTWFRPLYSNSFEVALHGAALILWGAGLGLLFAYILELKVK
jgi:Family of unknown function (DUF5367)